MRYHAENLRRSTEKSARKAFTLMEVLLAIAMISMLAFLVVGNLDGFMTGGQTKIAHSMVNDSFATPIMLFKLDVGRYPTTEEGLNALMVSPDAISNRWKGPYVRSISLDPWGNAYQYRFPALKSKDGYDIWSNGPDGQPDTEDDIGNW